MILNSLELISKLEEQKVFPLRIFFCSAHFDTTRTLRPFSSTCYAKINYFPPSWIQKWSKLYLRQVKCVSMYFCHMYVTHTHTSKYILQLTFIHNILVHTILTKWLVCIQKFLLVFSDTHQTKILNCVQILFIKILADIFYKLF